MQIAPHRHILAQLKRYELDLQEKTSVTRFQAGTGNTLNSKSNKFNPESNKLAPSSPYYKLKTQQSNLSRMNNSAR